MINMVALMGRLTFEPELRTTPSGVSVLRFQVACDRNYQRSGQDRQADFIDCVAWRQTAEFISRYFHKGSMIAVQGSIQTRSYEDKTGAKRTAVEIVADSVSFCGSKASDAGQNRFEAPAANAPSYQAGNTASFSTPAAAEEDFGFGSADDDDDGLPF